MFFYIELCILALLFIFYHNSSPFSEGVVIVFTVDNISFETNTSVLFSAEEFCTTVAFNLV